MGNCEKVRKYFCDKIDSIYKYIAKHCSANNDNEARGKQVSEPQDAKRRTWPWIGLCVFFSVALLELSEFEFMAKLPFHAAAMSAHLGTAFFIAGLLTFALEIPDFTEYIAHILGNIVLKDEYLRRLGKEHLAKLRRDCDVVRLGLSKEETENSFYKFVAEETWDRLIKSSYRTEYMLSAGYSKEGAPEDFWIKKQTTKYSFFRGLAEENLKIGINEIFETSPEEILSEPGSTNCIFSGKTCRFNDCSTTQSRCTYISEFKLSIDDVSYLLCLDENVLKQQDSTLSRNINHLPESIPVIIEQNLPGGKTALRCLYSLPKDIDKAEIVFREEKVIKIIGETTSIKMNIPTKDAMFVFSFPQGIIADAHYFGFRDENPFEGNGGNIVIARVSSWMIPGDGIALSWRENTPTNQT